MMFMPLKISSVKWQPFCPGGDELKYSGYSLCNDALYSVEITSAGYRSDYELTIGAPYLTFMGSYEAFFMSLGRQMSEL